MRLHCCQMYRIAVRKTKSWMPTAGRALGLPTYLPPYRFSTKRGQSDLWRLFSKREALSFLTNERKAKSKTCWLFQQGQDALRDLIRLRNHRRARLLKDLGARQVSRFGCEVGVLNAATGSREVFRGR